MATMARTTTTQITSTLPPSFFMPFTGVLATLSVSDNILEKGERRNAVVRNGKSIK